MGTMGKMQRVRAAIRIAGFHGDSRSYVRLYTENRIKRAEADEAWSQGQRQRAGGMRCSCHECARAVRSDA